MVTRTRLNVTFRLQCLSDSVMKNQLLLYREMIAVFYEIHMKHINTLCRQIAEVPNVIPGGK
jgi:hypothetical protein